tara:strand:- start:1885 stop:2622 length:738 start_codon:yes stop_codon:yes gene_type:complete
MLNIRQKDIIKEHALEETPKECCGVIDSSGDVVKCLNTSPFPEEAFQIDFSQVPNASEVQSFYHSHPVSLDFSMTDKYYSHKRNIPCIVYSVERDDFAIYYPNVFFELPLLGREFITNEVDCITLVRDYYGRNLNINIPDVVHQIRQVEPNKWPEREEFWTYNRRSNREFVKIFEARGFSEVEAPQKHDIILSDNGIVKALSHCAVYISDSEVMHHPYPSDSITETLSSFSKNSKIVYMRHKLMV